MSLRPPGPRWSRSPSSELALVRDGRWEEVPAASAQRLSAAQALGDPPADARPQLERLVELQHEIHAGLSTGRAFTLQKLGNAGARPDRVARLQRRPSPPRRHLVDGRA